MRQRRNFLQIVARALALGLMTPINVFAAIWNKAAFEALKLDEASNQLNVEVEIVSQEIDIIAPDLAENGAIVQVEVTSRIANTESMAILVENNPTPLIAHFTFTHGAEPYIVTRIKMAETSDIKVLVKVGDQYFSNTKNVTVLENGCG
ncbi:MAG: thiosulfate oxidation carrier protein SoxY [Methylotenera sp.]|nr:thiosulfate oxidation carrier protein SoxY [Methylotenera sp.]MSP99541.1 thiosulfate oxidation carrier protein SoxY [Methylotenera sp.]